MFITLYPKYQQTETYLLTCAIQVPIWEKWYLAALKHLWFGQKQEFEVADCK